MKEVEIKIKNIDKEKIVEKITSLGAKKKFSGRVIDFRFDTIDRDLSRQGKVLRVRQKGFLTFLNFKGKKRNDDENIIGRNEIGVRVSNLGKMQTILNEMGYIKIFELNKFRTEYKLEDVSFDIDEYVGLDPILEIESDNYDTVKKYLQKLEINEEDIKRLYIREIIQAKKKYDLENKNKNKN